MKIHQVSLASSLISKIQDWERKANELKEGPFLIEVRHQKIHIDQTTREWLHERLREYCSLKIEEVKKELTELGVEL